INLNPFYSDKITYKISLFGNEIDEIIKFQDDKIDKIKSLKLFSNKENKNNTITSVKNNQDQIKYFFYDCITFFIGLDFYENLNLILNHFSKYIILSEANKNQGESDLGIEDLSIENLDDFCSLFKDKKNKINIYTKNVKTIKNFIEYNSLKEPDILEIYGVALESFKTETGLVFICDDILSNIFIKKRYKRKLTKDIDLLLQIKPGDYIVHINHGVGIFTQIIVKDLSGIKREYIEIEYKNNDKLFVPISELYRVSKYIGTEDPKLTNLNTKEWDKIIKNTEDEVEKIALQLLELYAKKAIMKGFSFKENKKLEENFRKSFPYKYTVDQEKCIFEVLEDMEKPKPMDRLLTGDVGFGKTEVAMNAVYRASLNGKQTAFVSPLVVLAYDHYESLKKRFANFGVRIEVLTRVTSQKEETKILKKLREGEIDCIIGTHRLLSPDIKFKNLGLLVIDEEHKFGVLDKEKINEIKSNIDCLNLSATPIPRSLNLALSGTKDISIISSPPQNKKPIKTFISKFNDEIIKSAINAEFKRKGQVLFISNRVATIDSTKKYLETLLGKEAKIIITHGQMNGIELEDRIMDFKNRKFNILLTTTVIENGVNFLDANTIIINDADNFGLSQLHQLRGRISRKDTEGFCYLVYRKDTLPDDAKKRLVTILNNSHLGAGFEIALRDLEIRGAGDILGIKQSGKSKDVGLSLYFKLLEEKIEQLKSEKTKNNIDCKIELDLSYYIPNEFFQNEIDKIHFFRNLESIETIEDLEFSYSTFIKGVDKVPEELDNLFLILKTKIKLAEYVITNLKKVLNNYVFEFDKNTPVEKIREFLDLDKDKNFVIITIHKIKVETKFWKNDKEFLKSLEKI
ncbi:DEAD/DEAH box helicase, partial [Candidatus Gracilibacteria bacterium]|nr:DEAD/DEAH box helicase [Candidatus Gracilibacteria bacterium]